MDKRFQGFVKKCLLDHEGIACLRRFEESSIAEICLLGDFLACLAGSGPAAKGIAGAAGDDFGIFLDRALSRIEREIDLAVADDRFSHSLEYISSHSCAGDSLRSILFPEGMGLPEEYESRVSELRASRLVRIKALSERPIEDPAREILFTSNVLLTLPSCLDDLERRGVTTDLKNAVRLAMDEEQLYWYDHPIQIGVEPEANEILYGLRGLNEMASFEIERGNMDRHIRLSCVLSVSVTHAGLRGVARPYIESEIRAAGGFEHLDVYVFSEEDTEEIVESVIQPAAGEEAHFGMFGVDGEYGRHYSFLKAIAALWSIVYDPAIRATFKIDLDQVFPEQELVEQAGASAFEQFRSPLWGAEGVDAHGERVELGMIAGSLVNEGDIGRGLFTPDVPFRSVPQSIEEELFFSRMLMGLSTEAELMTRYGAEGCPDGVAECIQRIHVTGGTNGILVDSLRQHRPFTPAFIARAEDQAYILSILLEDQPRLRYLHADGLRMRHDKEAFAAQAIRAASFGNLIGDYIRTIYFSRYAGVLSGGKSKRIKSLVDPFTGCFISRIPVAVVMLRFCARAMQFLSDGDVDGCRSFIKSSWPRLERAFEFAEKELARTYQEEREGWDNFYEALNGIEDNRELCRTGAELVENCKVAGECSLAG